MNKRFEQKVSELMAGGKLSRSEACSILGKRGNRARKTKKRKIVYVRVNVAKLPADLKKLGRGDIVECLHSSATYTVLEGVDSEGCIMTEDAQGVIHPLRADRVKIISVIGDHTPMTAEEFALALAS